jgi:hypothetical protein
LGQGSGKSWVRVFVYNLTVPGFCIKSHVKRIIRSGKQSPNPNPALRMDILDGQMVKSPPDPYPPKLKKIKLDFEQKVEVPNVSPHLIQIKASNADLNKRIENFVERKRNEINTNNIREFCTGDRTSEFTCARVDAVLQKRKDSKGHLQVSRVLNTYHRDQTSADYLTKYIPPNGIDERLQNLEIQLSLTTPVPKNIYARLKRLEDRMLYLESVSPEYINFWDKTHLPNKFVKKKVFSVPEIDALIADLERKTCEDKKN